MQYGEDEMTNNACGTSYAHSLSLVDLKLSPPCVEYNHATRPVSDMSMLCDDHLISSLVSFHQLFAI
jgi:hypothetical protein